MSKVIFVLIFLFSIGQVNSQTVDELVESLNKAQILEGTDFVGRKSEQFKTFEKFRKIATIDDLLQLTNHSNPVIACYASWGLVDKNYNHLDLVFNKFQERNEKFQIVSGCEGEESTLSEALYLEYFNKVFYQKKIQTDSQLFKLDSLILFDENVSKTLLSHAFKNNTFKGKFLDRIKFIAFEQKKFVAMKYLFNNHKNCCEEKLAEELLLYLDNGFIHKNTYREIFSMLSTFDDEELRKKVIFKQNVLYEMELLSQPKKRK